MTDMGRRYGLGDMLKSVYDPNDDGVFAVAQTEADMTKAVYDTVIDALVALAAAHKTQHQNGGADEIDATGLDGIPVGALLGDPAEGRVVRHALLTIANGTNPATLKCGLGPLWNADTILTTDNIGKGATTGDFYLSPDGQSLRILPAGLSGDTVCAWGIPVQNACGFPINSYVQRLTLNIDVRITHDGSGAFGDITTLVNTGTIILQITYITDA